MSEWKLTILNGNYRIACGDQLVDLRFYAKSKGNWRLPNSKDDKLVEKIVRLLSLPAPPDTEAR